ncbi:DUF1284 domain-containing protein [Granulosicoccaceae sp. 1_MG-2023]|nr:DUF1284 domain-containing protein [Granulosicoccaceae sp. 1_MG-2023]
MPEPVRFRGHHLLCMLSYQSQGYTPAFVARFDEAVEALNRGASLVLESGPDMLCETVLGEPDCHCHNASVRQRDALALHAVGQALGQTLAPGTSLSLTAEQVWQLRQGFADGSLRAACEGCQWARLCTRIARQQFPGVRLFPAAPASKK